MHCRGAPVVPSRPKPRSYFQPAPMGGSCELTQDFAVEPAKRKHPGGGTGVSVTGAAHARGKRGRAAVLDTHSLGAWFHALSRPVKARNELGGRQCSLNPTASRWFRGPTNRLWKKSHRRPRLAITPFQRLKRPMSRQVSAPISGRRRRRLDAGSDSQIKLFHPIHRCRHDHRPN